MLDYIGYLTSRLLVRVFLLSPGIHRHKDQKWEEEQLSASRTKSHQERKEVEMRVKEQTLMPEFPSQWLYAGSHKD